MCTERDCASDARALLLFISCYFGLLAASIGIHDGVIFTLSFPHQHILIIFYFFYSEEQHRILNREAFVLNHGAAHARDRRRISKIRACFLAQGIIAEPSVCRVCAEALSVAAGVFDDGDFLMMIF